MIRFLRWLSGWPARPSRNRREWRVYTHGPQVLGFSYQPLVKSAEPCREYLQRHHPKLYRWIDTIERQNDDQMMIAFSFHGTGHANYHRPELYAFFNRISNDPTILCRKEYAHDAH